MRTHQLKTLGLSFTSRLTRKNTALQKKITSNSPAGLLRVELGGHMVVVVGGARLTLTSLTWRLC